MLEHTRYSWGHINFGFNKKLDDEDKDMAHLKYEFVYGTFDFSQQKIIWDIILFLFTISDKCFGVSSDCLNPKIT